MATVSQNKPTQLRTSKADLQRAAATDDIAALLQASSSFPPTLFGIRTHYHLVPTTLPCQSSCQSLPPHSAIYIDLKATIPLLFSSLLPLQQHATCDMRHMTSVTSTTRSIRRPRRRRQLLRADVRSIGPPRTSTPSRPCFAANRVNRAPFRTTPKKATNPQNVRHLPIAPPSPCSRITTQEHNNIPDYLCICSRPLVLP